MDDLQGAPRGKLAQETGKSFPLQICRSAAGYYIGTRNEDGLPYSRESHEYWRSAANAQTALERGQWTQKPNP